MNEEEALNSLMSELYGDTETNEPQQEVEVQSPQEEAQEPQMTPQAESVKEANEPQIQQPVSPVPADANKELIDRLIATQEQNQVLMQKIAEQAQQQQQPQMSEEEIALQQLKERLGLDKVEQENQVLRQQLEQVLKANDEKAKQDAIMREQQQLHEDIKNEANKFMKEYPDIKPETIMEYIKQQPTEVQPHFDTPHGWRMIATVLKAQAKTSATPDPIVSTDSGSTPTVSAFDRRKSGQNVSDTDLAMELLNLVN